MKFHVSALESELFFLSDLETELPKMHVVARNDVAELTSTELRMSLW